ncbi:MAG: lysine--tRNA ligase [Candidatus Woykebacteria bacterium RBG_16_43_9]|uniref:Lysine--tRNA ligase n=1 Tax=Candidatus Woykebacteria bacterium RBG_16_43_9 TaxID=1802596 RepID=A0A1G1WHB7_9BACT|nr:MAG: lysine--tRNA ligase [Candidatus Woykebacteria bacterium RBG_16_43_9]
MFWADKIAKEASATKKPHLVDDAKTPSGRVHVGALRGVIIHDLVYKVLQDAKVKSRYTFIIDDLDPMDDLPAYLSKDKYGKYMGTPLKNIPAPDGKGSYAEHYAREFIGVFNKLGANPEILWNSQLYEEGKLNKQIQLALDNAEKIQQIYEKIAGSRRPRDFIPFQPICEACGKIGTTVATDWDRKYVHYECQESKVDWAKGCGHSGKVDPFGGSGKLPWRVEWPAKWAALGVTVEGEGKDHASRGGSRDTANTIAKEIFKYDPPYDIPYEHFLLSGKKMSSSKGVGTSAIEVAEILPPELVRFLMVRPRPMQHIDFNPELEHTIPKLFDDFDIARTSKDPDLQRIWQLSVIGGQPREYFVPRFADLLNWVQMPNVDLGKETEKKKGNKLTKEDREALEQRVKYVKIYLNRFAPDNIKFSVKDALPKEAKLLTEKQKEMLLKVNDLLEDAKDPEDFQNTVYKVGKELGLSSADTFKAIYRALLGKESGPKAAWLILSLDKVFVKKRFEQVSRE